MDNINDENKPEVVNEIQSISNSKKKLASKNLSPQKFIDLVAKEYKSINKCSRILRKLEKFLFSDECLFGLEPKDMIKLMDVLLKYKHTSLSFLTKLYEVSTKNDLLRAYLEEKIESQTESVKQDARIRDIVNEIRAKSKEVQIKSEDE